MLQDINLLETISHATHERIPERIVHAKGAGAYGVFEVTHDITEFTSADFLSLDDNKKVGKKTPLFCRFSTVKGGRGSADTVRDSRGFAFKLYTEEGNLDWLFFSEPVSRFATAASSLHLCTARKAFQRTTYSALRLSGTSSTTTLKGFTRL